MQRGGLSPGRKGSDPVASTFERTGCLSIGYSEIPDFSLRPAVEVGGWNCPIQKDVDLTPHVRPIGLVACPSARPPTPPICANALVCPMPGIDRSRWKGLFNTGTAWIRAIPFSVRYWIRRSICRIWTWISRSTKSVGVAR